MGIRERERYACWLLTRNRNWLGLESNSHNDLGRVIDSAIGAVCVWMRQFSRSQEVRAKEKGMLG